MNKNTYDVALSFAGEDREIVEKVAVLLKQNNVKVFYDDFETANLWGKDLFQHLSTIYYSTARYCIIFISENYVKKLWTIHELRSAQARAFEQANEYILPVRLDDVVITGILPTIGFINTRNPNTIVSLLLDKIKLINENDINSEGTLKNNIYLRHDTISSSIIWCLPRGFFTIEDIEYKRDPNWNVKVNYYDYQGSFFLGVHYKTEYNWNLDDYERKCRIMKVPIGDWSWAEDALNFVFNLRNSDTNLNFEEDIPLDKTIVTYIPKGEPLYLPVLPDQYSIFFRNGQVRDTIILVEEILSEYISSLENIHKKIQSFIMDMHTFYVENLGVNHKAFHFLDLIINKYQPNLDENGLRYWLKEFKDILENTLKFIR